MSAAPLSDPFALFELEPAFALDGAELERRFFAMSRDLHPDRFATAPAAQRVAALSRSRALNDAYQVLRKPVPRAEYLLRLHGGAIGDNERLDPAFLQEILELREELAEARHAGQLDEVERLRGAMAARRRGAADELAPRFAELTAAEDPAARELALGHIKRTLIALRYLDRYLEECEAALDDEPEDS
ncbi:MAG: Fe-S protein assembly co-chaperone HscB [Kofleriaceae bacterium]